MNLLHVPVQLGCGHRMCKSCADDSLSKATPRCPECGDNIVDEDGVPVNN